MYKDSYPKVFKDKNKILCVFAHPDDAEIYAGGTIARLIQDKKEVCIVKLTLGNKGSRQDKITEPELAQLRLSEDKDSMRSLGIKSENNIYLDFLDGEVENNLNTIEALVKVIRSFKPDLIMTHNPDDMVIRWSDELNWINHRDHRNTGKSAIDAAYPYSRDILFFPHHLTDPNLKSHTVTEYLLVDYYDHQDTIAIDVTDTINIRTQAISQHKSQYSLEDAKDSTDFFTKLDDSGKRYERFRYIMAD